MDDPLVNETVDRTALNLSGGRGGKDTGVVKGTFVGKRKSIKKFGVRKSGRDEVKKMGDSVITDSSDISDSKTGNYILSGSKTGTKTVNYRQRTHLMKGRGKGTNIFPHYERNLPSTFLVDLIDDTDLTTFISYVQLIMMITIYSYKSEGIGKEGNQR